MKARRLASKLSQSRLRNALIVIQIAVCLTLLIAAGLLTRSLQKLQTIETGLVTKTRSSNRAHRATESAARTNCGRLAERLRALPGVKSVG